MQTADFQPVLQPRQGTNQAAQDGSYPADHDAKQQAGTDTVAPEGGLSPRSKFIRQDGYQRHFDIRPELSPTSRLSTSPNTSYPTYQAGVVHSVGKALPPPPQTNNMSPHACTSPPHGGPSVALGGIPGLCTPPRKTAPLDFVSSPPSQNSNPSPDRNHNSSSSPSRRKAGGLDRRGGNASSRIDPEQVPRPVVQPEAVKEEGGKIYETTKYHVPPSATAVCTIVDTGSCSCEFMRSSVNQMPAYPATANTAHVPVVVVCQPFAELTSKETPVPLVHFGESGPFRCTRCNAYINPHFTWLNNGQEAVCNFCGQHIDVPIEYQCALDAKGRRHDYSERPELQRGTVDYIAPRDYDEQLPGVPAIVFVIEASRQSVQSGLLPQVLWTLRSLVGFLEAPASRVAFITFDHALHFYAFHPGRDSARRVTVSDIEDPFSPCAPDVLCVDVQDLAYRRQVEELLDHLPGVFQDTRGDQAAGGAALKAAVDMLGSRGGGHVIMFHASLQNTGVGALRCRDDIKLSTAPVGGGLYTPQQAPFFEAVTADCLQRGVAVSAFCAPAVGAYIDVATLSVVPRRTGGEVCWFPGFNPLQDGEKMHYDISRAVVQNAVYSCVFKFRCCKGLSVDSMYATWEPEVIDPSTFHVSRLSVDATANIVIANSERIESQKHVYLQAACLHTDRRGRRIIRVHTQQLPVTSSLSNVFRYTDIDSVTNLLIKQAASSVLNGHAGFKDKLAKSCVDMLHAYRANCASMTSAVQLILPESLKLLPLYVGSIRKMAAFRSGSDIRVDDRVAALIRMVGLPIAQTAPLIYPRTYTLAPLPERAGLPTDVGDNVHMPPMIACSSDKLANDRIYLVDNGASLWLYIRKDVPADVLHQMFGVESAADVAAKLAQAETALSDEANRILAILRQIRKDRVRLPWQPFSVVVPGTPEEPRLLAMICEDRVAGEMNYVDFLCHIHKLVQSKQD